MQKLLRKGHISNQSNCEIQHTHTEEAFQRVGLAQAERLRAAIDTNYYY